MKSKIVSKKVQRGRQPVEYKLTLSFELEKLEDGGKVAGTTTLPIRKGAGARLAKYKKEDIAAMLHQIAEAVEKSDYAAFGPSLEAAIRAGVDATNGKGKAVAS